MSRFRSNIDAARLGIRNFQSGYNAANRAISNPAAALTQYGRQLAGSGSAGSAGDLPSWLRDLLKAAGVSSRAAGGELTQLARLLGLPGGSAIGIAQQLLEAAGYTVAPPTRNFSTVEPPPVLPGGRGIGTGGGGGGRYTSPPTGPQQPRDNPRFRSPHFETDFRNPQPGENQFGETILTPQSSNVFSFSYRADSSTLFVTFKAHEVNSDAVHIGKARHKGGAAQLRGKRGSTVGAKKNAPGATYAYLDVPARVYQRMKLAHSKGKFIWDELRIRGTVYGHKYRYVLMFGQTTSVGGKPSLYIPRRATAKGFALRSVAGIGTSGKRSFRSSTLAAQTGYSSRRR